MAQEHHLEKLKSLLKRCKGCSENFMRSLEDLDALRFEEHQSVAKNKRKSVATEANRQLDHADDVIKRIEQRLASIKDKN